jgi:hypothetical protein
VSIQEPQEMDTHHGDEPPAEALLRREVEQLQEAVSRRDLIGQAKGMLRYVTRCNDLTAFNTLSYLSQVTNRKLFDIAGLIMDASTSGTPVPPDLAPALRQALTALGAGTATCQQLTDIARHTDPTADQDLDQRSERSEDR